ncbi:MAG: hypothetical protein ACP5JH_03580 [Bacteroidota bacterium]
MPKRIITEEEREKIAKKVKREFPNCSSLQEIHFYRYLKELEQQGMTPEERIKDDKERAYQARKELGLER